MGDKEEKKLEMILVLSEEKRKGGSVCKGEKREKKRE